MKTLICIIAIALTSSFAFQHISFAACGGGPIVFICDTVDPNPDPVGIQEGGNDGDLDITLLPGSGINTTAAGTEAIDTGNGNNRVTLNQAEAIALDDVGISLGDGDDTVEINDSTVRCDENCVDTFGGMDVINVRRSTIDSADNNGISTQDGDKVVHVVDSQVLAPGSGNNIGINFGSGNDMLTVANSLVLGNADGADPNRAIVFGAGDDTLKLETRARIIDLILCGDDFDTIIFTMDVPEEALPLFSSEIANANPAGDTIVIDGLTYTWEDCELLVNQLNGVRKVRPIPTLSEWGIIAMGGLIGIAALYFIRRRKLPA